MSANPNRVTRSRKPISSSQPQTKETTFTVRTTMQRNTYSTNSYAQIYRKSAGTGPTRHHKRRDDVFESIPNNDQQNTTSAQTANIDITNATN